MSVTQKIIRGLDSLVASSQFEVVDGSLRIGCHREMTATISD